MGAPKKGTEATQAQITARLALGERNRQRKKYSHYVGQDERGSRYCAPCGHEVRSPTARMCWDCRTLTRKHGVNEWVGRGDRNESWFKAGTCGHLVHGARTQLCRKCWTEKKDREAKRSTLGGYKSVVYARKYEGRKVIFEHREIAERVLGRKLKEGEVVHHLNMDKTDNRNCNLLICTKEYHRYLHDAMMRAYAKRCSPPKEI